MATAKMLMIVPLMIWSARTLIDSQAWTADTSMAATMAAPRPMSSGRVMPNTARRRSGTSCAAMDAVHHATNAAVSIMPSMPIFTTPERSFMKPHSAPRAIGVAAATMVGAKTGKASTR